MICSGSRNVLLAIWTVYRKGCLEKKKMLIYFVYYYAFIVNSDMNIMPKICITNKLYNKKYIRTSKVKCRHLAQTGWPILRCCCELLLWDFFLYAINISLIE